MIFNATSGSNPLNFKVVASATKPLSTTANLIQYPYYTAAGTYYGVTYTDNGDGSVTLNGTNTTDHAFRLTHTTAESGLLALEPGTYTLSGCPAGGSATTYLVKAINNDDASQVAADYGSGATFTLTETTNVRVIINVRAAGVAFSNAVFKPQLEKGSVATSFVKYAQKDFTIWVKTGTEMPRWEMGITENPTWAMPAGFVYFRADTAVYDGDTTFEVLKKNSIFLEITKTWQNQGTSSSPVWVQCNSYLYRDDAWVQISSTFSATIKVTYPSGSTLTCTNGSTTLTATTTTGSYTFTVPNSGTWTVKAVSGSNTASESVSITTSGQSASVTLTYEVYLYNAGNQCTSLTGGWSNKEKGASYVASGSVTLGTSAMTIACNTTGSRCAYTTNAIALSGKTTLHVTISSASNLSSNVPAGIWVAKDTTVSAWAWTNVVASKYDITSTGTYTISISSVTTSCYIAIGIDSSGGAGSITVSKVWLT